MATAQSPGGAVTNFAAQETRISSHSGPLPSPEMLADYERLHPGSAERIFRMAEKDQDNRLGLENLQLSADISHREAVLTLQTSSHRGSFISDYIGQTMGFIVAMTCVLGAIYAGVVVDRPWIAAILLSVPAVGIVNAVRGMRTKEKPEK